jgi:oxygen-dependent protoporphyrinogen oxidase
MNSVGIIGGGIAGLSAAWKLSQLGIPFTLYESSNRLGGMIGTELRDGFLVERGPSTLLETCPELSEFIAELGIERRRVFPSAQAKRRYVVKSGRLHAIPQSGLNLFTTPLLSASGKMRVLLEPAIRRRADSGDESLSDFVDRRLGHEVLDYFVNPFVGGIYAGDPSRLSVAHAFPNLYRLEQEYGSLIAGTVLGARARARSRHKSKQNAKMFTFDSGMQVLVDALAAWVGESVQFGAPASALERTPSGWRIQFLNGDPTEHSAVVLCAPAHRTSHIRSTGRLELQFLGAIRYPPIARVTLGFRRAQVQHSLDGFGLLTPAKEGLHSLGVFFSSSLFEGRAPDAHVALNVFLGGSRNPELCEHGAAPVLRAAVQDVRSLLGVQGDPVFHDVAIIPRSIPQYEVGYGKTREAMNRFEQASPGLFLAGSYRDGIRSAMRLCPD